MIKAKKVLTGVLAASLITCSFSATALYANEATRVTIPEARPILAEIPGLFAEVEESYGKVTGKIVFVEKIENNTSVVAIDEEGNYVDHPALTKTKVTVETEDGNIVTFIVSSETIIPNENEIVEGETVTAFYDMNLPAIMIYPPQYKAEVMAVGMEAAESIFYGSFDENLVSTDNWLKLNISDDTEILFEDGQVFGEGMDIDDPAEELASKKLVVLYTASTRSIPAQTTPTKIIVPYSNYIMPLDNALFELAPEFAIDEDFELFMPELSDYDIVVEDEIIDGSAYWKDDVAMVPLRAIAEALDMEVSWDAATKSVLVDDTAHVIVGTDSYDLGAAPEIVDSTTYVPLSFFREALNVSNAYIFEGQIVVNQQEQMN